MWLNDYNGEAMFTIIKFIEVVITSILIIDFIKTLYKNKVIINVRWCAYYVFQVIFIIPNLIMLLYGKLNLYSYGYKFIVNNWQVEIIYSIFIIFTYCISTIIDSYIKLREFICKSKNHPKAKKGEHKN